MNYAAQRICQTSALLPIYSQSADALAAQLSLHLAPPYDVLIISGSGIYAALPHDDILSRVPYSHIPRLASSTVAGHQSEVLVARIANKKALIFGGRFHLYEGYTLEQTVAPVVIAHLLGIPNVVITNAAGGLNPAFRAGDIMLADDIVNATMRSIVGHTSPPTSAVLRGLPYCDTVWKQRIASALIQRGIAYREGSYVALTGPTYETRAEVGYYRRMADAIGMSTVHEAQCALQLGMNVSVCSTITNVLSDTRKQEVTHEEVIATAAVAQPKIKAYIECACITTLEQVES